MSHMVNVEVALPSLELLEKAAEACGLELVRDQKTHKWYPGGFQGDYPLPAGFTKKDLGRCEHAIRVKGNPRAYEIGVVRRKDGRGWTLLYDFWNGGEGLEKAAGKNCQNLLQQYGLAGVKKAFLKQGFRFAGEPRIVNGKLVGKMVAA